MSISSSLAAGVAGLSANASRLATISDNIANSSTYGYKAVQTDFSSLVLSNGSGNYSAGGVRSATMRLIDEQGPITTTSNPTDLAISGRGMLPVTPVTSINSLTGGTEMLLTPTGSFRPDEDGYLRSTNDLVLLGWPTDTNGTVSGVSRDTADALEPVRVNVNQFAGDPTTLIELGANLPATATEAGDTTGTLEMSVEYFGNLGVSERLDLEFEPTVPLTGASNTWTMRIYDAATGGTLIGEYEMVFNDTAELGGTISSVSLSGAAVGQPYDPDSGTVTVTVGGRDLDVAVGTPDALDGVTQLSDVFFARSPTKDGSPVGILTSVSVDENGFVNALYDVGFTRTIFQVPLVDVSNLNGLTANSDQTFGVSLDSGPFFLWDAGDGPTGRIQPFSREESATDVAAQLTQLIQTQRAYSSNAKVIQTVDEMLQEATNIIR